MTVETISFPNAKKEILSGRLDRPEGPLNAYAIFAHCFTCSKQTRAVAAVSRALARRGIAVLRFDFTGLGESEGEFGETTFSSNVDDLVAAGEALTDRHMAPAILVGHSFGGTACLAAAPRLPSVKAVATIGSPFDPAHVQHLLGDARRTIQEEGQATVTLAGRPFRIKRTFLDDLEQAHLGQALPRLHRALLVLHSPVDEMVGIDNAADIYAAARHPKSFISLDNADHMLRRSADAEYAGSMIAQWAARYVAPDRPSRPVPSAPPNGVTARIGARGYRTPITAGGHGLVADEPVAVGGTDQGPGPYDLLLSALGACTAMTLRMYADHKGWPLEGVVVHLSHEKIHARDCQRCETREGRLDRIHRRLELSGPLDPDQRQRLGQIADRCPVHRTLHGEIEVVSEPTA